MKEDKIFFLGKEYAFPHEVYEYIIYCREFQEDRDELLSEVFERVEKKKYAFPDTAFEEKLKNVCKTAIKCLACNDIYNITENDLLKNNKAYVEFKKIEKYAIEQMQHFREKEEEEYKEGYEKAYTVAVSQVTGSGLGLISNSIMAHMAFAAMESNTVRQQAAKAEKQLKIALKNLSVRTGTNREEREWALVAGEIYPSYINIIGEFVAQIIDEYLSLLEKNGIFSYSKVYNFSIDRSSELLKNLKLIRDKQKVLEQAFECCPYNVEIYQSLVDMDLLDSNTESTLLFYEQKDSLLNSMKEQIDKIFSLSSITQEDIEIARNNLKYSARLRNIDISELERNYFNEIQKVIADNIKQVYNWQFDEAKIEEIDIKIDSDDIRAEVVRRKLKDYITSQLVEENSIKIYNLICGEDYIKKILSDNRIDADSLTAFVELMTNKLNEKLNENRMQKATKAHEIYEQKQGKKKKRLKVCIGAILLVILLIMAKEILYASKRRKIENLCQEVNSAKLILNVDDFTNKEWVKEVECTVETGVKKVEYYDYLHMEKDDTITIYVKDEFDQLDTLSQYNLIETLGGQASYYLDEKLENQYPEYCKYINYSFDSEPERYLSKIYKNTVFYNSNEDIYIVTSDNTYEYAWNVDYYYMKNGKEIYVRDANGVWLGK